ncbi:hypothetical protein BC830DRAFT_1169429 [Chytriomyces sp. MP71]|nr:hypothetical protein BC830DRAFT_1169429 [Chytriomyces sp. MP71]
MHAVIVGSGLVGAATAVALAQVGVSSALYDQVDLVEAALKSKGSPVAVDFGDSGGAVMLQASALRVMSSLGLLDQVMEGGFPSPKSTWLKMDGSAPIEFDIGAQAERSGETDRSLLAPIQIMRSKLHSILMQACHRAGVKTYMGKKLVRVTESSSGVTAHFADGASATGDILIGADGVHSATRGLVFGKQLKAQFTGKIGYIAVVKTTENNIQLKETVGFYIDRNHQRVVNVFKTTADTASIAVYTIDQPEPEAANADYYRPATDLPGESNRLADLIHSWGVPKHLEQMVRKAYRITPAAIYDLPNLPTFVQGNVLLIGDSAHGMLPNGGLGLGTGLEDVGVLRELFRRLPKETNVPRVFELYNKIRVPRAHANQEKSRELAAQYYSKPALGGNFGHWLLRMIMFAMSRNWIPFNNAYNVVEEVEKVLPPAR